jgi:hypothetical protein
MAEQHFGKAYRGNSPANYERFFVPAIGAPLATDLIRLAALRPQIGSTQRMISPSTPVVEVLSM